MPEIFYLWDALNRVEPRVTEIIILRYMDGPTSVFFSCLDDKYVKFASGLDFYRVSTKKALQSLRPPSETVAAELTGPRVRYLG